MDFVETSGKGVGGFMSKSKRAHLSHPGYCWFIEVLVCGEWKRMSKPYADRKVASSRVNFCKKFWYAESGRTVKVKLKD